MKIKKQDQKLNNLKKVFKKVQDPLPLNFSCMPLSIIHPNGRKPYFFFFGSQGIEVISKPKSRILYLQDAIFSIMLIRDAEEFSVVFPCTKP